MAAYVFTPRRQPSNPTTPRDSDPLVVADAEEAAIPSVAPEPTTTDIEALGQKQFKRLVRAREILAERTESILVHDFRSWLLESHGLDATGLRIPYAAEGRNLRADLFITAPRVLVEAKASSARESIRMAIGQLLDYQRWVSPAPRIMVLTPSRPSDDMCLLLESLEINYGWQAEGGRFLINSGSDWMPAS